MKLTTTDGVQWAFLKRFKIAGRDGRIYLDRLRLIETPWFSVKLHHILDKDPDEHPHDHPWRFKSIILRGGYWEDVWGIKPADMGWNGSKNHPEYSDSKCSITHLGRRGHHAGTVHSLGLNFAHKIVRVRPNTWTLCITGPRVNNWSFYLQSGGKIPWQDYVRMRDGVATSVQDDDV